MRTALALQNVAQHDDPLVRYHAAKQWREASQTHVARMNSVFKLTRIGKHFVLQ